MNKSTQTPRDRKTQISTTVGGWEVAYRGSDILDFAEQQGWEEVYVIGHGNMITSPTVLDNGWTVEPYEPGKSIIPPVARQRLNAIHDAMITYRGLLIGHEPEPEPEVHQDPVLLILCDDGRIVQLWAWYE